MDLFESLFQILVIKKFCVFPEVGKEITPVVKFQIPKLKLNEQLFDPIDVIFRLLAAIENFEQDLIDLILSDTMIDVFFQHDHQLV